MQFGLFTDDPEEGERVVRDLMRRFGRSETEARDGVSTGRVTQIQDKIGRLQKAGIED